MSHSYALSAEPDSGEDDEDLHTAGDFLSAPLSLGIHGVDTSRTTNASSSNGIGAGGAGRGFSDLGNNNEPLHDTSAATTSHSTRTTTTSHFARRGAAGRRPRRREREANGGARAARQQGNNPLQGGAEVSALDVPVITTTTTAPEEEHQEGQNFLSDRRFSFHSTGSREEDHHNNALPGEKFTGVELPKLSRQLSAISVSQAGTEKMGVSIATADTDGASSPIKMGMGKKKSSIFFRTSSVPSNDKDDNDEAGIHRQLEEHLRKKQSMASRRSMMSNRARSFSKAAILKHERKEDDRAAEEYRRASIADDGLLAMHHRKQTINESMLPPEQRVLRQASKKKVPLHWVVSELERRTIEEEVINDLIVYIPFVVMFTVYFLVGRNIEDNHMTLASIKDMDTQRDHALKGDTQIAIVNNYFRENPILGNRTPTDTYIPTDGEEPPIPIIPYLPNFLQIRTSRDWLNWFKLLWIPGMYDCSNPNFGDSIVKKRKGSVGYVGAARLRVIRVRDDSCQFNNAYNNPDLRLFRKAECYDEFSKDDIDRDEFCGALSPMFANETLFKYTECNLATVTVRGERTQYPCSGHYALFPMNATCNEAKEFVELITPYAKNEFATRDASFLMRMQAEMNDAMGTEAPRPVVGNRSLSKSLSLSLTHNEGNWSNTSSTVKERPSLIPQRNFSDEDILDYALNRTSCSSFVMHKGTRMVLVEYYLYNLQSDAFFRVKALTEITQTGAWLPNYQIRVFFLWSFRHLALTVFEFFFFAFVLYFMRKAVIEWYNTYRRTKNVLSYFLDPWNLLELTNLVTFVVSLSLRWTWWTATRDLRLHFSEVVDYPAYLDYAEHLYTTQVYANSVNVVITYLKILRYLRLNDRLNVLSRTLELCQGNIFAILFVFVFVNVGYAAAGVAIFGTSLRGYKNMNTAWSSMMFMILGRFQYEEMRGVQPVLGPFYFWTYVFFGAVLMLNFFVVILSEGFSQMSRQTSLQPLADTILRAIDQLKLVLTTVYISEYFFTKFKRRSRVDMMRDASDFLRDHYYLLLDSHSDATTIPDPTMEFKDLEWWIPPDLFDELGLQFLLVTWEDIVYEYYVKEKSSDQYVQKESLRQMVACGLTTYLEGSVPDLIALELISELVEDKLERLPVLLAEADEANRMQRRHSRRASDLGRNSSSIRITQ